MTKFVGGGDSFQLVHQFENIQRKKLSNNIRLYLINQFLEIVLQNKFPPVDLIEHGIARAFTAAAALDQLQCLASHMVGGR